MIFILCFTMRRPNEQMCEKWTSICNFANMPSFCLFVCLFFFQLFEFAGSLPSKLGQSLLNVFGSLFFNQWRRHLIGGGEGQEKFLGGIFLLPCLRHWSEIFFSTKLRSILNGLKYNWSVISSSHVT